MGRVGERLELEGRVFDEANELEATYRLNSINLFAMTRARSEEGRK